LDSLTQIVLGASVGEAVLGKKIGNKALLYGAIAGTIPDLDVLANTMTDTITAIEIHRGISHSLVFSVLMVNQLENKHYLGWKSWTKLFFFGLVTHPLLDAFTTWGTQLFWPFDLRLAFNTVFVIDPFYTVPFLGCVIGVLFQRRGSKTRQNLNYAGLTISTAYLLLTVFFKSIVDERFKSALEHQQLAYTNISTRPAPLSTMLWNANIETQKSYLVADYSFFDSGPIQFTEYPKNREASRELLKFPNVQRMVAISEGWYIIEKVDGQWFFYDLRFGLIPRRGQPPFFAFTYLLEETDGTIKATEAPKTERDATYLLKVLWKRIKGRAR